MEGSGEFRILKDKWTAVSVDDKRYTVHKWRPFLNYTLFPDFQVSVILISVQIYLFSTLIREI